MSNKLAGQRAKFSRARAIFYTTADERERDRAVRWMGEVLRDAPANDFTEREVTQGEDVPDRVRDWLRGLPPGTITETSDAPALPLPIYVEKLARYGSGGQYVYAYGYRYAPDRLKIGSATGDPYARVTAQISTGTPDRPDLVLLIETQDCRALERTLHGTLRLRGKQVDGAGAEWFRTDAAGIVALCEAIVGAPLERTPPDARPAPFSRL